MTFTPPKVKNERMKLFGHWEDENMKSYIDFLKSLGFGVRYNRKSSEYLLHYKHTNIRSCFAEDENQAWANFFFAFYDDINQHIKWIRREKENLKITFVFETYSNNKVTIGAEEHAVTCAFLGDGACEALRKAYMLYLSKIEQRQVCE